MITNEVGLGVHPETELGRSTATSSAGLNQAIAAIASKTRADGGRQGAATRRPMEATDMTWLADALPA